MSERVLVVIEKEPGCTCQDISRGDEGLVLGSWEFDGGDYEEERCGYEWEPCTHGSTVRLATVSDIPADLAAEALVYNAEGRGIAERMRECLLRMVQPEAAEAIGVSWHVTLFAAYSLAYAFRLLGLEKFFPGEAASRVSESQSSPEDTATEEE